MSFRGIHSDIWISSLIPPDTASQFRPRGAISSRFRHADIEVILKNLIPIYPLLSLQGAEVINSSLVIDIASVSCSDECNARVAPRPMPLISGRLIRAIGLRSTYERVARIDRVIVRDARTVIGYSDYPADFVTFLVSISLFSPFHF